MLSPAACIVGLLVGLFVVLLALGACYGWNREKEVKYQLAEHEERFQLVEQQAKDSEKKVLELVNRSVQLCGCWA